MDMTELRNSVEHVAAVVRHPGSSEEAVLDAVASGLLVAGQVGVGIYEELTAIRKALEHHNETEEHY